MRVVEGLIAVAHVYVEERERVTREPTRLEADGAAADGPFGAVFGGGHAAAYEFILALVLFVSLRVKSETFEGERTWIHPLHSVREPRR